MFYREGTPESQGHAEDISVPPVSVPQSVNLNDCRLSEAVSKSISAASKSSAVPEKAPPLDLLCLSFCSHGSSTYLAVR